MSHSADLGADTLPLTFDGRIATILQEARGAIDDLVVEGDLEATRRKFVVADHLLANMFQHFSTRLRITEIEGQDEPDLDMVPATDVQVAQDELIARVMAQKEAAAQNALVAKEKMTTQTDVEAPDLVVAKKTRVAKPKEVAQDTNLTQNDRPAEPGTGAPSAPDEDGATPTPTPITTTLPLRPTPSSPSRTGVAPDNQVALRTAASRLSSIALTQSLHSELSNDALHRFRTEFIEAHGPLLLDKRNQMFGRYILTMLHHGKAQVVDTVRSFMTNAAHASTRAHHHELLQDPGVPLQIKAIARNCSILADISNAESLSRSDPYYHFQKLYTSHQLYATYVLLCQPRSCSHDVQKWIRDHTCGVAVGTGWATLVLHYFNDMLGHTYGKHEREMGKRIHAFTTLFGDGILLLFGRKQITYIRDCPIENARIMIDHLHRSLPQLRDLCQQLETKISRPLLRGDAIDPDAIRQAMYLDAAIDSI